MIVTVSVIIRSGISVDVTMGFVYVRDHTESRPPKTRTDSDDPQLRKLLSALYWVSGVDK